jgi:hypothetical protein
MEEDIQAPGYIVQEDAWRQRMDDVLADARG